MSDSFKFTDDNLNIEINIYEADDTDGNKFIAETIFDYVTYKSRSTRGKGFEQIEIGNFSELHEMFPPEVNILDIKTIKVTYNIPFLKSTIDFFLIKEEVTAAKETLIKYKKHTEIINSLENRIRKIEAIEPVRSKPSIVDICYNDKDGLYFDMDSATEEWFMDIMRLFYAIQVYPTYNSAHPVIWQSKYKNIKDLFKNVQNLYYVGGSGQKIYTDLLGGISSIFGESYPNDTQVPYALYNNYAKLSGYKLTDHVSGKFPLSVICDEMNQTTIRVASIYLFDRPTYRIYRGADQNKDYLRSIIEDYLNPITNSNSRALFGIYPNNSFHIASGSMYTCDEKTLTEECCRVVWYPTA